MTGITKGIGLLLLVITITSGIAIQSAFADTTGAKSPTDNEIDQFSSPTNAFASDNARARGQLGDDQAYGGFSLSVPSGATINSLTVSIEAQKSGTIFGSECGDAFGDPNYDVRLSNPTLVGNPTGTSDFTGTIMTTSDFSQGTDTTNTVVFSPSHTATELDNLWILITANCGSTFGFSSTRMDLDHVTVDVDYTSATEPDVPVVSVQSVSDTSATFEWTEPSNGGSAITGYHVETSSDDSTWTDEGTVDVSPREFTKSSLLPNEDIYFRISAINAIGESAFSDSVMATTNTIPPDFIDDLVIDVTSYHSINLSWTQDDFDGIDGFDNNSPLTNQAVECDSGNGFVEVLSLGLTDEIATIDTLTPLTDYVCRITVENAGGTTTSNEVEFTTPSTPHNDNPLPRPTFGIDMNTNVQAVECGFELNNQCYTLTDKWHTPFEKVSLETGTENNIELNVMAQMRLKDAGFCLVPQVGSMEGEICIGVSLDGNGEIVSTNINQNEPIIDEEKINFSVSRNGSHYNIKINNVVFLDIPFYNVVGLYAVDYSPSATEQFLNEGIGIFGQSFVEQPTIQIASNEKVKYGDSGTITLTRVDKFENIWTTDDGKLYTFNEYMTPFKVSPDEFTRTIDITDSVMTRQNSNFVLLQDYEQNLALETMKSKFPSLFAEEPFAEQYNIKSYDYPEITDRQVTLSKLSWHNSN